MLLGGFGVRSMLIDNEQVRGTRLSLSDRYVEAGRLATPVDSRNSTDRLALRQQLFRESPRAWVERNGLGLIWSLVPSRIGGVPAMTRIWLRDRFARRPSLPDPESPLNAGGVVGVAYDLSIPSIIAGAKRGLFPMGHVGQPKWWSPEERGVVSLDAFHIPKKLRKLMRQGQYSVTFDRAFEQVIAHCAGRREGHWHLTWVSPRMMRAYAELYDAGHVHSFEVWNAEGELVGGGYGLAVGGVFVGESLFSLAPNASKFAFVMLAWHLAFWGYRFIDTKIITPLSASLGFHNIPRREILEELDSALKLPGKEGRWREEVDVVTAAEWRPEQGPPGKPAAEPAALSENSVDA